MASPFHVPSDGFIVASSRWQPTDLDTAVHASADDLARDEGGLICRNPVAHKRIRIGACIVRSDKPSDTGVLQDARADGITRLPIVDERSGRLPEIAWGYARPPLKVQLPLVMSAQFDQRRFLTVTLPRMPWDGLLLNLIADVVNGRLTEQDVELVRQLCGYTALRELMFGAFTDFFVLYNIIDARNNDNSFCVCDTANNTVYHRSRRHAQYLINAHETCADLAQFAAHVAPSHYKFRGRDVEWRSLLSIEHRKKFLTLAVPKLIARERVALPKHRVFPQFSDNDLTQILRLCRTAEATLRPFPATLTRFANTELDARFRAIRAMIAFPNGGDELNMGDPLICFDHTVLFGQWRFEGYIPTVTEIIGSATAAGSDAMDI